MTNEKYNKEIKNSWEIAKKYREKINPINKNLSDKDAEEITNSIDFIEVFNSINNLEYNQKAQKFAEENKLTGISSSNEYNSKPGRAYTILNANLTRNLSKRAEAIKEAIKKNEVEGHRQKNIGFFESLYVFAIKEALLPVENKK